MFEPDICNFTNLHKETLNQRHLPKCGQIIKKVQVGKDQEKAQSERDSHSKNRGGKKQTNNQALIQ